MKFPAYAWVAACLVAVQASIGAAQEADPTPSELRLKRMRRIAERVQVTVQINEQMKQISLVDTSLLRFSDPTRELHDATVWAWGTDGRPACLLTVELYGDSSHFELISLTDVKVAATAGDRKWNPQSAGLTMQRMSDWPKPVKETPLRLAQMKELLGKLSAHEIRVNGKRFELRLLAKPIHRYSAPTEQVLDGAIFVFANGTNPELLAVIEACGEGIDSGTWRIGFARSGAAELHVVLDEHEFFHAPLDRGTRPNDPYWIFEDRSLAKE